jgi:hypothetical protein
MLWLRAVADALSHDASSARAIRTASLTMSEMERSAAAARRRRAVYVGREVDGGALRIIHDLILEQRGYNVKTSGFGLSRR